MRSLRTIVQISFLIRVKQFSTLIRVKHFSSGSQLTGRSKGASLPPLAQMLSPWKRPSRQYPSDGVLKERSVWLSTPSLHTNKQTNKINSYSLKAIYWCSLHLSIFSIILLPHNLPLGWHNLRCLSRSASRLLEEIIGLPARSNFPCILSGNNISKNEHFSSA